MILAVNVSLDSHRVIIGMSKEDSVLKYESVADDIVQKISAGNYRPNDKLPTTEELCEQYQVSKITIKKAMDDPAYKKFMEDRGFGIKVLEGKDFEAYMAKSDAELGATLKDLGLAK